MEKIRKGDQVVMLSGRDKGRRGAVVQVLAGTAVLIENINRVKRHTKANPQANQPGGIIEKEMPVPLSKVALWNPSANFLMPTRSPFLADGFHSATFDSGTGISFSMMPPG